MVGLVKFSLLFAVIWGGFATQVHAFGGFRSLNGHRPLKAIGRSTPLGRKKSSDRMRLAISLNVTDTNGLNEYVRRVYDPKDSLYHHFLTPVEFVEKFSPSQSTYDQAVAYATSLGLTVVKTHPDRMLITVEGTVNQIEDAFQVQMHDYLTADGRVAFAPDAEPVVSEELTSTIGSIVGLSSFSKRHPHYKKGISAALAGAHVANPKNVTPSGLTPARIRSGYNLTNNAQNGGGEVLALYELDGYVASDITTYANNFSLNIPTITNVLYNGADSSAGSNADEVTLDIELAMAIAPGLSKILVYIAPHPSSSNQVQNVTEADALALYSEIANDNLANEVSTSWGQAESYLTSAEWTPENTYFQKMAVQGQSMFAAAGDNGAYDASPDAVPYTTNNYLAVDDPGAQPYVTSVGGTRLTLNSSNAWSAETSWKATAATASAPSEGGGGGISTVWAIPSYQSGVNITTNLGSSTMRMVPDVALAADPNVSTNPASGAPYPVYIAAEGGWVFFGGTSCAAPIWAGFTALVNQQRVANGNSRLGFVNPFIYAIGEGASYASSFHDIADNSTNLHYPAVTGYDLTTGWGSFNGAGLLTSLVAADVIPSAPSPVSVTPGVLSLTVSWPAVAGAATYTVSKSTSSSGPFTAVSTAQTGVQFVDTAVVYGTHYYYEVTATNTVGTSGASTPVSASCYPSPPGAPTSLTVVPE